MQRWPVIKVESNHAKAYKTNLGRSMCAFFQTCKVRLCAFSVHLWRAGVTVKHTGL